MPGEACAKCNRSMATANRKFKCSKCAAQFCPSCMDRFCLFCKGAVKQAA